jgi:hypothetical protein
MKMKKMVGIILVLTLFVVSTIPASAARVGFGNLFYECMIVRTVVPPASMPQEGRDNLYAFPEVEGQLAIAAVAPGHRDYHGGKWAVHIVIWNVEPYPLCSEANVLEAADAGEVTIVRLPGNDFKCPIQP